MTCGWASGSWSLGVLGLLLLGCAARVSTLRPVSRLALIVFVGAQLMACSDCDFEVERVRRFVQDPAHQQCAMDADCTLRRVPSCLELAEAPCGQVTLSLKAAESSEWQEIETDVRDCGSDSCPVCNAQRVAVCQQGSCR